MADASRARPGPAPVGEGSESAGAALAAVRDKIDDYFTRCALAAFDPRAANALNGTEADYLALAGKYLSVCGAEVAALPIAFIDENRPLPLATGLNPAWHDAVTTLHERVARPLLGESARFSSWRTQSHLPRLLHAARPSRLPVRHTIHRRCLHRWRR